MIHYLIAGLSIFFLGILLGYFLPRRSKEKGADDLYERGEKSERLFWTDYFATTGKIHEGIDHPDDETTRADLLGALKEVLGVMEKIFKSRRIEIEMKLSDGCPLVAIPKQAVLYVLKCLLLNSAEAMTEGGNISIVATPPTDKTGDSVRLEITDNGCGISDEAAPKLFTPFFSTKKRGTGLGLYSARQLIEKFDGKMLLESVENGGTRAILFLPGVIVS